MSRFCSLFSSSSGNASCLVSGDTAILFDCGKNAKQVLLGLRDAGIEPEMIRAVCITHEHSDHISALTVLSGKLGCPVYAPAPVAAYLERCGGTRSELRVIDDKGACVGDVFLRPFHTPHDSVYSVGYQAHTADDRTVGVATDLGHVTDEVAENLLGCDLVLLESNYDKDMLRVSSYPAMLRRRIAGANGHLCNDDCAAFLPKLVESGTTRLLLGHLSRENNTYELARANAEGRLAAAGMVGGRDYRLEIAERDCVGYLFAF